MKKGLNINAISLAGDGAVVLSDAELKALEKHAGTGVSAGGLNDFDCGYVQTNTYCWYDTINEANCGGSSNTDCMNTIGCRGAANGNCRNNASCQDGQNGGCMNDYASGCQGAR